MVGDAAEGGVPAWVSTSHGAGGPGKGLARGLKSELSRMSFAKKEKGLPASFRAPSSGLTCIECMRWSECMNASVGVFWRLVGILKQAQIQIIHAEKCH